MKTKIAGRGGLPRKIGDHDVAQNLDYLRTKMEEVSDGSGPHGQVSLRVGDDGLVFLTWSGNRIANSFAWKISKDAYPVSPSGANVEDSPTGFKSAGITLADTENAFLTGWFFTEPNAEGDRGYPVRTSAGRGRRGPQGPPGEAIGSTRDLINFRVVEETLEYRRYAWERGSDVDKVFIYEMLHDIPGPDDPWPGPGQMPNKILGGGQDTWTLYYPDAGQVRRAQFEPRTSKLESGPIRRVEMYPPGLEPPFFEFLRQAPGTAPRTANVHGRIHDPVGFTGELRVWVNKTSNTSPDPSTPPQGTFAIPEMPYDFGPSTVFTLPGGGTGKLLENIPYRPGSTKTIFVEFISHDERSTGRKQVTLEDFLNLVDAVGELRAGSIWKAEQMAEGMDAVFVLDSVPTSYIGTSVIVVDGLLYRWNGTSYSKAVPTVDLVGEINTSQIADAAITAAKVGNAAITEAKVAVNAINRLAIQNAAINAERIATNAVTIDKIAANAVTAGKIAAGAVGTDHLANLAVSAAKVADSAIVTAKLANDAVEAGKLATNAVTSIKIATNAITETKIESGAITTPKLVTGAVVADKIAANAVTAAKIAAGSVEAEKIAAGAVTTAKLDALAVTAGKIDAGAITAEKIAAGAVTATTIAANAVTTAKLDAFAVTAAKIEAGAIIAGKIAANAVEANNIAANAVTAGKIAAEAVTTGKLDALAVTAEKIATNAIIAAKIASGAVTTVKLDAQAVTAEKIAALTITAGQIATNAITSVKIAANAVTANEIAANTITASQMAANSIATAALQAGAVRAEAIAAGAVTTVKLEALAVTADKISVGFLSAIAADVGTLTTGRLQNTANTAGVLLSGTPPSAWESYLRLSATGTQSFLRHPGLDLRANGDAIFSGDLSAAKGTFSGTLSAAEGTFSGDIRMPIGDRGAAPRALRWIFVSGGTETVRAEVRGGTVVGRSGAVVDTLISNERVFTVERTQGVGIPMDQRVVVRGLTMGRALRVEDANAAARLEVEVATPGNHTTALWISSQFSGNTKMRQVKIRSNGDLYVDL